MTRIFRFSLFAALFLPTLLLPVTLSANNRLLAASDQGLISHSQAESHGLTRAWFTQARLDPGRGRVSHVTFVEKSDGEKSENHPDTLFLQTDRAGLHVIDAETGQTLWVRTVGQPAHPSLPLGVNEQMVAVVNGTKLYILKRQDGKTIWTGPVSGVPMAGVAMSKRHVFVPTISGRVIGYLLEKIIEEPVLPDMAKDKAAGEGSANGKKTGSREPESLRLKQGSLPELTCGSSGAVNSQPLIMRDDDLGMYIAWTTPSGMFVAHIGHQDENHFPLLYELAGENKIAARPCYMPSKTGDPSGEGVIFVASVNGSIFAHSERQGVEVWRRATGQPIVEPLVPIGGQLYATSALGGIYCLDSASGDLKWTAPQIMKFVAASPTRLYVSDKLGRLLVLDAKTGARIDTLPFSATDIMVRNMRTDRIYLIGKTGLVQCLHETELAQPFRHPRREAAEPETKEKGKPKAEEEKDQPESGVDPFA